MTWISISLNMKISRAASILRAYVKGGDFFSFVAIEKLQLRELKKGYSAQRHALVAAKNLKLLMSGEKESKLSAYEPQSSFIA
ncbi:hypothetical protein H5410_058563 [Solanum commersonii]|uniref:Uncharacterized protein n=1 Tax=Solanum commersonii TaxID=4109 RepID=A0A9J5WT18_SOLCO|nr:hypothetical protein H5410_058563 [Solanum commersonii]